MVFDALLNAGSIIYGTFRIAAKVQIKPIVQVLKIVAFSSVSIAVLALLLGQSPWCSSVDWVPSPRSCC